MKYSKLILLNTVALGLLIVIVHILDLFVFLFYIAPTAYAFLLLLNKQLRARPVVLGITIACGWLVGLAVVLAYIKLRTCDYGTFEWFCEVDTVYPFAITVYAVNLSVAVTLTAFIVNRIKQKASRTKQ